MQDIAHRVMSTRAMHAGKWKWKVPTYKRVSKTYDVYIKLSSYVTLWRTGNDLSNIPDWGFSKRLRLLGSTELQLSIKFESYNVWSWGLMKNNSTNSDSTGCGVNVYCVEQFGPAAAYWDRETLSKKMQSNVFIYTVYCALHKLNTSSINVHAFNLHINYICYTSNWNSEIVKPSSICSSPSYIDQQLYKKNWYVSELI